MNNIELKLRETVKQLIEAGTVGYVIGWEATKFKDKTKPAFISKPEDAQRLVWNTHCVNSLAKYALDDPYPDLKIGICVRGCDSRAVNRLLDDKQLTRENLYLIGIPCDGVENDICKTCTHKNPVIYDTLLGEPVAQAPSPDRFREVERMEAMTADARYDFWSAEFDKCIRCYACRNVCPACNCRECYVDQHKEGWQGKQNNRAQSQVYGLTRAYHVGDRCIECGECERVCPMNLPIMLQTKKILRDINDMFGPYECGLPSDRTPILGEYRLDDADTFM